MSNEVTLAKARVAIAKYNRNHDRRGRFASSPGGAGGKSSGRTNTMDGMEAMGAPPKMKKSNAEKSAEIDALKPAQQKKYENAPAHFNHDEAMRHALGQPQGQMTAVRARGLLKDELAGLPALKDGGASAVRGYHYADTNGVRVYHPSGVKFLLTVAAHGMDAQMQLASNAKKIKAKFESYGYKVTVQHRVRSGVSSWIEDKTQVESIQVDMYGH